MLDMGWGELMVVGVVALIVVGPKDLPGLLRTAGNFMGRARGMARDFQRSMEAAADESGLKGASDSLKAFDRLHLNSATGSARKYADSLVKDIDDTVGGKTAIKAAVAPTVAPAAPDAAAPKPAEPSEAAAPSKDPAAT